MSPPSSSATDFEPKAPRPKPFRWKSGLAILAVAVVGIALIRQFAPDQTFRVIYQYYFGASCLAALIVWWLGYSGVPRAKKVIGLLAMVVLVGGAVVGMVRHIAFDGAMAPRFEFRWQPDAEERLNKWLTDRSTRSTPDIDSTETLQITNDDWPRYCGADGSRIVHESLTERDWKTHPPQELWRHPIGAGWSSFAVVGHRLFTQEQRGDEECVVCYHADTGDEIWKHTDAARHDTAMGGLGPRATPTVTEDGLFALGATGILNCLHPVTGESIWQRNICDDARSKHPEWGCSASPLIFENTVIVDAGGQADRAVIAYDRATGDIVWTQGSHRAGYSSPRLETINGQVTLLVFHGDGLLAMNPATGESLWEYPHTNMYHINAAQPIYMEGLVFIATGYDGRCVALDPSRIVDGVPAEAWPPTRNLKLKFNEAVAHEGFVYGLDDGILRCLNVTTGEPMWKGGRYRYGQILLWDDALVVQAETGEVALVEPSPDGWSEITRFAGLSRGMDGLRAKVWNVPVVNRGRLYLRSGEEVACFEVSP